MAGLHADGLALRRSPIRPRSGVSKKVDAAQECALAGARSADDRDDVALCGRERDAFQDLERTEAFVDVDRVHGEGGAVLMAFGHHRHRPLS